MKNNDFNMIIEFTKGAISIFKSILTVFCQAFKKRVTLSYPEQKPEIPDKFRGMLELNYEKCIGCGLCAKICPAMDVLKIKENENGIKKLAVIDVSRCIFCGNCAYNCPTGALNITKQYELATNDKKDLILDCKKISEIKAQKETETQAESEISQENIQKAQEIVSSDNQNSENTNIPAFVTEEEI